MSEIMISNDSFVVLEQLYFGKDVSPDLYDAQLRQLRENGLILYQIIGHRENRGADPMFSITPIHPDGIVSVMHYCHLPCTSKFFLPL